MDIEGVSRYGKATLVTMVSEPRFTSGLPDGQLEWKQDDDYVYASNYKYFPSRVNKMLGYKRNSGNNN